ncbi:MAG: choice-of-anchor tandem repeat GloVer-containing protein, partial [Candidatus Cybelea sp.]
PALSEPGEFPRKSKRAPGTVFSITPGGTERVLHSFNGTDGANPYAALIAVKGLLYGTTEAGGAYNYGVVFSLKP